MIDCMDNYIDEDSQCVVEMLPNPEQNSEGYLFTKKELEICKKYHWGDIEEEYIYNDHSEVINDHDFYKHDDQETLIKMSNSFFISNLGDVNILFQSDGDEPVVIEYKGELYGMYYPLYNGWKIYKVKAASEVRATQWDTWENINEAYRVYKKHGKDKLVNKLKQWDNIELDYYIKNLYDYVCNPTEFSVNISYDIFSWESEPFEYYSESVEIVEEDISEYLEVFIECLSDNDELIDMLNKQSKEDKAEIIKLFFTKVGLDKYFSEDHILEYFGIK